MADTCDFAVVGGGIAGASAAAHLARHGRVVVLERENQPGHHATGRSAAMYTETYGNPTIRALTLASRAFLETPPAGFSDHPLLSPRGLMLIATTELAERLAAMYDDFAPQCPDLERIDGTAAHRLVPALKPGTVAAAVFEPGAREIDVHRLLSGYLGLVRRNGGRVVTDAEVTAITREGGAWSLATRAGRFSALVVVDAAGAWADSIARLAGLEPIGITPKRRTAVIVELPAGLDAAAWPLTILADETLYFRPEAGRLLVSPADETPSPACDAQPEDTDVALGIERLTRLTDISVRRIEHKWAGLRSFAADKSPVVGFEPSADGFFWLAGQGGYGVHTADALARLAAASVIGEPVLGDIAALGVTAADLAPARLRP